MVRPTWHEYKKAAAEWAKTRAPCNRRQVGAAIFDEHHYIVSSGYNGVAAGLLNCSDGGCPRGQLSYDECPAFGSYANCNGKHAERNAIESAVERGLRHLLTRGSIYVTHDPCADCAALITEVELAHVFSPSNWDI